eukprot:12593307-Ditylum_brightwellii.AAC.1
MSVTLRDMGLIHERSGREDEALQFYHESLETAVKGMKKRKSRSSSGAVHGSKKSSTTRDKSGGCS